MPSRDHHLPPVATQLRAAKHRFRHPWRLGQLRICGIAAVIGDELPESAKGEAARVILGDRGPDDCGVWQAEGIWLASWRLAIIDVSSAGRQPVNDPETGVTLVFNGTTHNYVAGVRGFAAP